MPIPPRMNDPDSDRRFGSYAHRTLAAENAMKIAIMLLAVPFSLIGTFWLIYLFGYNMRAVV